MTAPTRLIVVRHGQTECNVRDVWHGWDDCSLDEVGRRQAAAVAERLAVEPIVAVYSSDTRRALQTAQAIGERHRLQPITDPDLRERNAGEYEGVAVEDVVARRPTVWEERNADYWGWRPPSGESFDEVWRRVDAAVRRIEECYPGKTVVVVTHMGPARLLISSLAGIPLERTYDLPFPSTGVSIFTRDGTENMVEALNDAAHVP